MITILRVIIDIDSSLDMTSITKTDVLLSILKWSWYIDGRRLIRISDRIPIKIWALWAPVSIERHDCLYYKLVKTFIEFIKYKIMKINFMIVMSILFIILIEHLELLNRLLCFHDFHIYLIYSLYSFAIRFILSDLLLLLFLTVYMPLEV